MKLRGCLPRLARLLPDTQEPQAAHVVFQKPQHHPSSKLPVRLCDMAYVTDLSDLSEPQLLALLICLWKLSSMFRPSRSCRKPLSITGAHAHLVCTRTQSLCSHSVTPGLCFSLQPTISKTDSLKDFLCSCHHDAFLSKCWASQQGDDIWGFSQWCLQSGMEV